MQPDLFMAEEKGKAVLILAAGSIKNKYQSYTFLFNSPALVPVASRSVLSIILDFYLVHRYACYVCVNRADLSVLRAEMGYYSGVVFIDLERSAGVVDSLRQSLELIPEDDLVVNLVTCIPVKLPAFHSLQLSHEAGNVDYYSGIEPSDDETTSGRFHFKGTQSETPFFPFTGVFRTDKNSLKKAVEKTTGQTDLLQVVASLNAFTEMRTEKVEWIDVGHEINYAEARRKMISSRSFNSISVSSHSGILTKKSKHTEKLVNESKYVTMLPTELQVFYPRIFADGATDGTVTMEYYGYPNLSEYQLYRDVPDVQWMRIFQSLEHVLRLMRRFPFSIGKAAFHNFYFAKTLQRIRDFKKQREDGLLFGRELVINGVACQSFEALRETVEQRIETLYHEGGFSIMHGDFCFNNILYDMFSGTAKLIDPRGSFGDRCVGIYGDPAYDLAKLLHSTVGHYDYVVNNLFQLEQLSAGAYRYSFPLRKNQPVLAEQSDKLLQNLGADPKTIRFMVGLLFLSMCPLHSENPNRQTLMYLHGLHYINQNL